MNRQFSIVPQTEKMDVYESEEMNPTDAPFCLRKRYYVIIMLFLGYLEMSLIKINLNVCIVDLTSNRTVIVGNSTYIQKADYDWTPPEKGLLLSAVSWGNLVTPLGALVANKFGGIRTFGFAVLLAGFLTVLSPMLIQWNLYVFFLARCIEGMLQGVCIASAFTAFVKWVPPVERARLVNFAILGMKVGAAVSYPVVGFISHYFTWKHAFYFTGGVTLLWYILLALTVRNSPTEDKFITKKEKHFFLGVCEQVVQDKVVIPWKSIFTSIPVYAYWNDRFVEGWSDSFLYSCLPLYIKDIHPTNIKDIGILSGIPHLFAVISAIAFAWLLDYFRSKDSSQITSLHKKFILIGQVPGACLLIIIGFWGNFYFAMIAFSIFKICFSAAHASYYVLPLDMSLQHNNLLISVGITLKSIASIISPIALGFMVQNHLLEEWSRYFWFLSIFNLYGAFIFAKYGSGEVQPWAYSYKNAEGIKS